MSWTPVASNRGVDTVTIDSTGANILLAAFLGGSLDVTGWDNKGNGWNKLTESIVSGHRCTLAYCLSPGTVGAGHTLTDPSAGVQDADIHFYALTAPGAPTFHSEAQANDGTFGGEATNSANRSGSLSVTPPSNDNLIFAAVTNIGATTSGYGVSGSATLGQSLAAGGSTYGGASAYLNQATAATIELVISWTGSCRWSAAAAVFTVAATAAVEQEGFRFGNDDGAESAHTWAATQDAGVTAPAGATRLVNVALNVTSNPADFAPKLQYRKVGETLWRDVPT
ncbi:MAG TPA: hypothetical protein PL196_11430 [Burkholderiaceae bacterium]|nr:hypothetical protein [Burkholderiaceae bacterium]